MKPGRRLPALRSVLLALGLLACCPGPALAVTYGAIAIDENLGGAPGNGDYAVGEADTPGEARRIAMSNCTGGGNVACAIKITYEHCGAYASSSNAAAPGTGGTKQQAIAAAMAACKDAACRPVVADCIGEPLRPLR